jgi:uncharacterized protein (DUF2147 family)
MSLKTEIKAGAAIAAAFLLSTSAHAAASDPTGVWFDHNGRGAVEIKACEDGNGLCGYVVHVKEQKHADRCGLQILGHVTPGGGGWIYSPERGSKYDVALKRLSDDKLRVVGNAGSRFFSRTFTWNRAPDDLARCGETTAAAPKPEPAKKAAAQEPEAIPPKKEARPAATSGSAALLAGSSIAPRREKAETKPEPESDVKVAANTTAATSKAKTAKASTKTTKTASASDEGETGAKRTCTYRIPYVGRTVSVPCRN